MLSRRPIKQRAAFAFIRELHRNHKPPRGWFFGISAWQDGSMVGVISVGRPVAKALDDGMTAEANRCCTDGARNACSFLYGAAWRAVEAIGFDRIITYTLPSEGGASLRGSGWTCLGERGGGKWSRPSRGRQDDHPTEVKLLWEKRRTR